MEPILSVFWGYWYVLDRESPLGNMKDFSIYRQDGVLAQTVANPHEPSNSDYRVDGLDVQTDNNVEHMFTTSH